MAVIKKEILSDNTNITASSKQLEILKQNFPNCFDKNGAFIPHKMAEIVGANDLDLSRESYSLNWLGKSYARLLANENPQTLLKEDKEHNAKEENCESQNLLIRGDNLEVLKHLKNAYSEKIKMIYIDPPYNTGNDGFIYNDDRKFIPEQLATLAGIELDEAKRILEFTQSKSNSHSAWLTFMYPRLYVARELLREDGVIFISIDDNEVAQLKMLCDEVFGEENFVGQFIWQRRQNADNRNQNNVSTDHEYLLCYTRIPLIKFTGKDIDLTKYKNPDNDTRGNWASIDLSGLATKDQRPNLHYNIIDPNTGNIFPPNPQRGWSKSKSVIEQMIADGLILFPSKPTGRPREKKFLNNLLQTSTGFSTCLSSKNVGFTTNGTRVLSELFDSKLFDFPKPLELLKELIKQTISSDEIILDFFAGSGTTAHAVMALNAEDGGNRRFITVQIDEPTDPKSEAYKAGYETIFDITKARIEKAAAKIKLHNPNYQGNLGFKIFETIPLFDGYLDEMENLDDGLELYDGSKLNEAELGYLLTTWKTYDGIALTEDLRPIKFADYQAYTYEKNVYFIGKNFTSEALSAFIKALDEDPTFQPSKLVLFGYNFQSKFLRETAEGLKSYKNKKSIELDVVVRY